MAFKKDDTGQWTPVFRHYPLGTAFAAGVWNIGPGGGRFAPAMRPALPLEKTLAELKAAGCTHVEFHDTEAEPEDAEKIMAAVRNTGLAVSMCTANLFKRGPEFANGNFGSAVPATRAEAVRRTKNYIRTGIEVFDARRLRLLEQQQRLRRPAAGELPGRVPDDGGRPERGRVLDAEGVRSGAGAADRHRAEAERAGELGRARGLRRDAGDHRP